MRSFLQFTPNALGCRSTLCAAMLPLNFKKNKFWFFANSLSLLFLYFLSQMSFAFHFRQQCSGDLLLQTECINERRHFHFTFCIVNILTGRWSEYLHAYSWNTQIHTTYFHIYTHTLSRSTSRLLRVLFFTLFYLALLEAVACNMLAFAHLPM